MSRHYERYYLVQEQESPQTLPLIKSVSKTFQLPTFTLARKKKIDQRRGPASSLSCIVHEVHFGYRVACAAQKLLQEFPRQVSAYEFVDESLSENCNPGQKTFRQ